MSALLNGVNPATARLLMAMAVPAEPTVPTRSAEEIMSRCWSVLAELDDILAELHDQASPAAAQAFAALGQRI